MNKEYEARRHIIEIEKPNRTSQPMKSNAISRIQNHFSNYSINKKANRKRLTEASYNCAKTLPQTIESESPAAFAADDATPWHYH